MYDQRRLRPYGRRKSVADPQRFLPDQEVELPTPPQIAGIEEGADSEAAEQQKASQLSAALGGSQTGEGQGDAGHRDERPPPRERRTGQRAALRLEVALGVQRLILVAPPHVERRLALLVEGDRPTAWTDVGQTVVASLSALNDIL